MLFYYTNNNKYFSKIFYKISRSSCTKDKIKLTSETFLVKKQVAFSCFLLINSLYHSISFFKIVSFCFL